MHKTILILWMAILLNSCTNAQTGSGRTGLSAIEFSQRINGGGDVQLVDVRTPGEYRKGHLANAININVNDNDFDTPIAQLDKSKTVYVYCLSGGRSSGAAATMRNVGFKEVIEMPGGMMEWRAKNLPETATAKSESGMTIAQYEALLQSDKVVLIDFYADWCAPCKKMKPYLDKIAAERPDKVTIVRIDADQNAELCKQMSIASLPVLKLYKNKKLFWEKTGFAEEKEVRERLK